MIVTQTSSFRSKKAFPTTFQKDRYTRPGKQNNQQKSHTKQHKTREEKRQEHSRINMISEPIELWLRAHRSHRVLLPIPTRGKYEHEHERKAPGRRPETEQQLRQQLAIGVDSGDRTTDACRSVLSSSRSFSFWRSGSSPRAVQTTGSAPAFTDRGRLPVQIELTC